jgi:hypothetical protein
VVNSFGPCDRGATELQPVTPGRTQSHLVTPSRSNFFHRRFGEGAGDHTWAFAGSGCCVVFSRGQAQNARAGLAELGSLGIIRFMNSEEERKKIAATSDINALLQIEGNRELFHKVRDWIFATKCGPMEPYESYSQRLSEGERYVILAWCFVAETTNGGIHQYLTNSTGDLAEETRPVLREIGATLAAEALDAARKTLFGGKPIPADGELRDNILSAWDEKHGEGAAYDFLDKFDGELGCCESVDDAIAKYIRSHPEMFIQPERSSRPRDKAFTFDQAKADKTIASLEALVRRKKGQS